MTTSARPLGRITTFYSYKGGTGRTMLLANVAWILASAGKRVLAIDWDLEAPGLHQYFHPFLIDPRLEATDGLIDMVVEYSRSAVTPEENSSGGSWLDRAADVRRFVARIDWPFPDEGLLHILPAGRQNASFSVRVNTFHWHDFYERLNGGAFLELVKDKIQSGQYDHILIDSRTGVSDTSGICTVQMPDRLVVCFTGSEQSIRGSAAVAASTWAHWARLKTDNREGGLPAGQSRRIFPILMRIESSEKEKLDAARAHVREVFGWLPGLSRSNDDYWNKAEVGYWPFYAFEEMLAVFGDRFRTETSLLAACEHVASLITDGEVTQFTLPEPRRREQVLAAYERRTGRERAEQRPRIGDERHAAAGKRRTEPGQRWFFSCNSQDSALMERVAAALRRKDPDGVIFFAPTSPRLGGLWLPELGRQIAEATAFVLLVGEHGVGAWQAIEYYEALDRRARSPDFALIVVLLEGQSAPGLPFLRQLHWIVTPDPAADRSVGDLRDAAAGFGAAPSEPWRHTAPYRGLSAMTESDADFFYGRGRETAEVIETLASAPDKLPLLLGNSGVGKSSVAQAGVLAALMRQGWPETAASAARWPQALDNSRHWGFLKFKPGLEPVRALVESFLRIWQFDVVDPGRQARLAEWTEALSEGRNTLSDLLDATEDRLEQRGQTRPPAFLIYVDQGEELYVRADERQRRRLSQLLADGIGDRRLRVLMSMRSDFLGELQSDEALYAVHRLIHVPPLREAELREVVSRPAKVLSARFETDHLPADIARRAAEESARDVGALPLLSYLLDDMWSQMVTRGDGVLRLSTQLIELGGVLGQRADAFLYAHPNAEERIRRIFTLNLAQVREDGEPTRRRAAREEFLDEEWRLVSELTDHPNRLLVTATSEAGETHVEVASEAIFRRWDRLREWIAGEREFLAWRSGLEAARRVWQSTPYASQHDALLMGLPLAKARGWSQKRAIDLPGVDRDFIALSIERERRARVRALRARALVYGLLVGIIGGLVGWINQTDIKEQFRWYTIVRPFVRANIRPYVLSQAAEIALKQNDNFRECASDDCPEMIVLPAGRFVMGSPPSEPGRSDDEGPQHTVTIARPFAISKYELTFDEWDACVAYGNCQPTSDNGWGRVKQPTINVTWQDAQRYVAWLSQMTGKPYRLLSEAEYEYAARAGSQTVYPWGDAIGMANADCNGCGSKWDNRQPAPVGSFGPNGFGLFDMVGNVWEWVEDCYHSGYDGAPMDGSAWSTACSRRVVRGGSWGDAPRNLRAASRGANTPDLRVSVLGFRIGRTLAP